MTMEYWIKHDNIKISSIRNFIQPAVLEITPPIIQNNIEVGNI